MKGTWQEMAEVRAEFAVVQVPNVRRTTSPFSPASVHARWVTFGSRRTLNAVMKRVRAHRLDDPNLLRIGEAEVTAVELPLGPACRVRQTLAAHRGWEPVMVESVRYFVLERLRPKDLLVLDARWYAHAVGPGMEQLADQMAATLAFVPADSEGGPRPSSKLTGPDAPIDAGRPGPLPEQERQHTTPITRTTEPTSTGQQRPAWAYRRGSAVVALAGAVGAALVLLLGGPWVFMALAAVASGFLAWAALAFHAEGTIRDPHHRRRILANDPELSSFQHIFERSERLEARLVREPKQYRAPLDSHLGLTARVARQLSSCSADILAFLVTTDEDVRTLRQWATPWRPGPLAWARRSNARAALVRVGVRDRLNAAHEQVRPALSAALDLTEQAAAHADEARRLPGARRKDEEKRPARWELATLKRARKAARASVREVGDAVEGMAWRSPGGIRRQVNRILLMALAYLAGVALMLAVSLRAPGGHWLVFIVIAPILGLTAVRCLRWQQIATLTVLALLVPVVVLSVSGLVYQAAFGERTVATVTGRDFGRDEMRYELREFPGGEDLGPMLAIADGEEYLDRGERLEVSVDPLGWVAPVRAEDVDSAALPAAILAACAVGTLLVPLAYYAREVHLTRRLADALVSQGQGQRRQGNW
jgi:hypothetical protein